jgi:hypothetical protein
MRRLLYFLGGAAIGLIAPKVVTLVKEYYDENIKEYTSDVDTEVENGIADPDAVIVPINEESAKTDEAAAAAAPPPPAPAPEPAPEPVAPPVSGPEPEPA